MKLSSETSKTRQNITIKARKNWQLLQTATTGKIHFNGMNYYQINLSNQEAANKYYDLPSQIFDLRL